MRYDQFQKIRRRQKDAAVAKTTEVKSSRRSEPRQSSAQPQNANKVEAEVDMRDPIDRPRRSADMRSSRLYSHNAVGLRMEGEKKMQAAEPSDLVDTIRAKGKAHRKSFLPIAMPRADPPQAEASEYEYRSEFEAPDHVEVAQASSYETRTDVSEITSVTYYGIAPVVSPRATGSHFPSRTQHRFAPHVEHLEDIEEVSESQVSYLRQTTPPRVKVDVTDLEAIFDERKARSALKQYESRYGLPYETTDFRVDDEASEDSWGKAIVGNHVLHTVPRRGISANHEPIDAEKYFSQNVMDQPPTPTSQGPSPSRFSAPDVLVKETMSADGSMSLFIDLSQIEDEESHDVEDCKKGPQKDKSVKLVEPQHFPQNQAQKLARSLRSARSARSAQEKSSTKAEPITSTGAEPVSATGPNQDPPPSHPVELKVEDSKQDAPSLNSISPSPVNVLLAKSMAYFSEQIKTLADGLGSQLEKIDLLPEKEMDNMLGVLNKDLKATSEKVPEGKEVVQYLGKQIRNTACASGKALDMECGSPQNLSLNFSSASIEEMVDSVKNTYQKNLANCGIQTPANKPAALAPQTFIVPISLRGKDYYRDQANDKNLSK